MYIVQEIFYSLQGEGWNVGQPAVFCRFAGCNLWSGRECDRARAQCRFCDTVFIGAAGNAGGNYATAAALATRIAAAWPNMSIPRWVICTGGEPLLQLDTALIAALHQLQFQIAVETNGTLFAPHGIDWICVSPKAGTRLSISSGDELKLIYPQPGAPPELFTHLAFRGFFLQPLAGSDTVHNIQRTISYCLKHPRWRLSVQLHKLLGFS